MVPPGVSVTAIINYQLIMHLSILNHLLSVGINSKLILLFEVDTLVIIDRKGVIGRNNS